MDWYPTLLKLAGANPGQKLAPDGVDIWPVLTQNAKAPRDAILLHGTSPGKAAVRMGDWKLLLNANERDAEDAAETRGKVELYNLADDPAEAKNLADSQPEKVKELRARLDVFLKDAVNPGGTAQPKRKRARKS